MGIGDARMDIGLRWRRGWRTERELQSGSLKAFAGVLVELGLGKLCVDEDIAVDGPAGWWLVLRLPANNSQLQRINSRHGTGLEMDKYGQWPLSKAEIFQYFFVLQLFRS